MRWYPKLLKSLFIHFLYHTQLPDKMAGCMNILQGNLLCLWAHEPDGHDRWSSEWVVSISLHLFWRTTTVTLRAGAARSVVCLSGWSCVPVQPSLRCRGPRICWRPIWCWCWMALRQSVRTLAGVLYIPAVKGGCKRWGGGSCAAEETISVFHHDSNSHLQHG